MPLALQLLLRLLLRRIRRRRRHELDVLPDLRRRRSRLVCVQCLLDQRLRLLCVLIVSSVQSGLSTWVLYPVLFLPTLTMVSLSKVRLTFGCIQPKVHARAKRRQFLFA